MSTAQIEILLATYNGAPYLTELLDSLLYQTVQDFHILIRDDGSTDETPAILHWYASNYPNKITLLDNNGPAMGPTGNFSRLLEASSAPYVMLCDQDDVWHADKLSLSLEKMHALESLHTPATPLLVHTDLAVVDQLLNPIAPSFFAFSGLKPARDAFHQTLVQNVVTGCTTLLNRALVDLAAPIPPEALMHDWWIALVASGFGKVGLLAQATVEYRQHGKNALGANRFNLRYIFQKARGLWKNPGESILQNNFHQAAAFQARYAGQLPPEAQQKLTRFLDMQAEGFIRKRATAVQEGFVKGRFSQNVGLLLRL